MSYSLHATKKYDMFELCQFNRDVKKVRDLKESMRKHGFIPAYPLHVVRSANGKLWIKAGHHRFDVARALGLAVFYVICDDDANVPELEKGTVHWQFGDFISSHCRVGSAPHLLIKEYVERTGIGPGQVASMLAGESASSGNQNSRVKDGSFEAKSTEHIDAVAYLVMKCKEIGIDFAAHRQCVAALSLLIWLPEFNSATFLHRVAKNPGLFVKQATSDCYLAMFEAIYNRQSQKKIALAFLAKEAARERAMVKHSYPDF